MLRQLFTVSVFISVVLAGSIFAEEKTEQIKGPIVITSQTLLSDNKARTALFEGSVVAKTENMTLYSDKMLVYYAEGSGNVTKIEAEGRVKLVKKDLVVTSKAANYFADEEKIIFTGEPKAVEKGNIVTGTKMTYLMKEDRSFVENSRVLLENKKGK
ncbi:MAG: LptA/OstA family protein [Thermodesulfovibrionales bacterium]|nr:LptA/OstA family protein [Nitrospinota bacterium]MCG2710411.1 LptA/OstA family protein [Thermodesulfovibrionales bacterium]